MRKWLTVCEDSVEDWCEFYRVSVYSPEKSPQEVQATWINTP